jgi:hypothetical protein
MATETVSSKPLHDGWWEPMIPALNNTSSVEFREFKLPIEDWTSSIPLIESTINRIHQEQREDQNWSAVELERVFGGLNAIGSTVSTIDQKVVLLSLLAGKRPKHLSNDHKIITLWDAIDRALSNITHMEEGMIQDQEHWIATDGRLDILEQVATHPDLAPRVAQLGATVEKIGASLRTQFTVALKDLDGRTRMLQPDKASGKTLKPCRWVVVTHPLLFLRLCLLLRPSRMLWLGLVTWRSTMTRPRYRLVAISSADSVTVDVLSMKRRLTSALIRFTT